MNCTYFAGGWSSRKLLPSELIGIISAQNQPGCMTLFLAGTSGVATLANDWLHQNSLDCDIAPFLVFRKTQVADFLRHGWNLSHQTSFRTERRCRSELILTGSGPREAPACQRKIRLGLGCAPQEPTRTAAPPPARSEIGRASC